MTFSPGAIAATFASTDARTFLEPPEAWRPTGNAAARSSWFEGSPDSLVGDLIREGVTGVAGHVSEPYLHSVIRPEVLFEAYLTGFSLIESYYLAMPSLSWQTVVIGDPLARPFAPATTDDAGAEPGMDPGTGLPELFAARRVDLVAGRFPSLPREAAVAWVRASGARARGDVPATRDALLQVLELAPDAVEPRVELAMIHDQAQEHDEAIVHYRRILELQPRNIVALNNLAYALAVYKGNPEEALPLAERAATLAPGLANVLDTFAWVEHLLGRHASAAARLAQAIRLDPAHAEIRLHAAVVLEATGNRARAEVELKEALRLDPSLEDRDLVRELRAKLRTPVDQEIRR